MLISRLSNEMKIGLLKLFVPQGEKIISSDGDWSKSVKDTASKALERSIFSNSLFSKNRTSLEYVPGPAFHEKSEKNSQVNRGGSYRREIAAKYKKPKKTSSPTWV